MPEKGGLAVVAVSIMLIVIGVIILLLSYGLLSLTVPEDSWKLFWPLILIVGGVILLVFRNRECKIEKLEE